MYKVFKLPYDFLNQKYSEAQKAEWDHAIHNFCSGNTGQLQEELTKSQIRKVDTWWGPDREAKEAHSAAFSQGEDRVSIPFAPSDEKMNHQHPAIRNGSHSQIVAGAVHKAGYAITDYAKGLAKKIPKEGEPRDDREHSIGKILNSEHGKGRTWLMSKPRYKIDKETGSFAKDENGQKIIERPARELTVSEAFAADPLRSGATKKTNITFTKNKYDVAGMSTDRGWSSCMNMGDGVNRHYLPHDINHGTITAYHTETSDDGIKNPIGRINLKKFVGTGTGHVIYRPENSEYGAKVPGFKEQVHKWSEEKWPMKDSEHGYIKAPELYNDDGKSFIANPKAKIDHKNDEAIHKSINMAIRAQFGAETERQDNHFNKFGDHDDHTFDPHRVASKTVDSMMPQDPHRAASVAFHGVRDLSDSTNDDHNEDADWRDNNGEDHFHRQELSHHLRAKNLTDEDLAHHVRKYNAEFGDRDTEESYNQIAQGAHAKLHDELWHPRRMNSPSLDAVRDETIHHYLDNREYHGHLTQHHDASSFDDTSDLPQATKNPRVMHRIFDEHEPDDRNDGVQHNPENYYHAGKYADEKLARHVAEKRYDDLDPEDHQKNMERFVRGMSHNPHGEAIQHALTSQMYLSGGHSDVGGLNHLEVKNKDRLKDVMSGDDHYMRDEGTSDEDHNMMFHAIAHHSTFKSVRDKLRNRSDVPDEVRQHISEEAKYRAKTLKEILGR